MTFGSATDWGIKAAAAGLSVIPVKKDKRPALKAWKQYQESIASDEVIKSWQPERLAVVAGQVSGGLECIDIDTDQDATGQLLKQFTEALHALSSTAQKLYVQRTPSGGAHLVYRCDSIEGNLKLACTESGATIIETRGEGGYFLCAPAAGYLATHGDILHVQRISVQERADLLTLCKSFDQRATAAKSEPRESKAMTGSPGDEYSNTVSCGDVLQEHGWSLVYSRDGGPFGVVEYYRRPGKDAGLSATLNFTGPNRLHVFSSNAVPFESGRSYSAFAVLALLRFSGDFKECAAWLRGQGFGKEAVGAENTRRASAPMRAYLSDAYDFCFNVITGAQSLRSKNGQWRNLDDRELNNLYWQLESEGIKTSREKLDALLNSDFSPEVDPFADWLRGLPVYDGQDYIQELAETTRPVADDMDKFSDYLRRWLVGHVAQIKDGKANQSVLVLKGGQGVGKTTWLNRLCPAELQEYLFIGDIDASSKDSQILVAERFIVNLDELENMQKADVGHLKSLITTQQVTVRRPYARRAVVMKRRASFVGSVNRDRFLTDDTGNRRFLVAEMLALDAQHTVDVDRVYSQALHLYQSGWRYWLTQSEIELVNAANEVHRVETTAEDLVQQFLTPAPEGTEEWNFYTTTQLATQLCNKAGGRLSVSDYFVRQLGQALGRLGFAKISHQQRYGWRAAWRAGVLTDENSLF